MRYGYARTSTKEQNPERQRVALQEEDCEELFVDQCSGKNAERPQLQLMMSKLRAGDTVVVKSVDRLARNTKDLLGHCCKVSDEAAFCLIQRPYISKTLLTRRISPRGSP
ncbi:recombinase family protein [Klebsiella pneumoniae]|nr:recombinase family protein [Klebsiella pneumoniae]